MWRGAREERVLREGVVEAAQTEEHRVGMVVYERISYVPATTRGWQEAAVFLCDCIGAPSNHF